MHQLPAVLRAAQFSLRALEVLDYNGKSIQKRLVTLNNNKRVKDFYLLKQLPYTINFWTVSVSRLNARVNASVNRLL